VVSALEAYLQRDHHAFDELLVAPDEHPVAVGAEQRVESTDLGLGPDPSAETTAPVSGEVPRPRLRLAAVAALAGVALVGAIAAGTLLAREPERSRPAAPPPVTTVVRPSAPAPAVVPPPETPTPAPVVAPAQRPPERRPAARPAARPRNVYRPVGD
jgi:hypothetical protein